MFDILSIVGFFMNYAPVVLFVYNRPIHTKQTLDALRKNTLAKETEVIIYSDGPKDGNLESEKKVLETRKVVEQADGFKAKKTIYRDNNIGLGNTLIAGITEVVNEYGTVIVLEDDIITGKYFLEYMNIALDKYKNDMNVWHITGYRLQSEKDNRKGAFFYPLMDCWSWATWKDRWQYFKKDPENMIKHYTKEQIKSFNVDGLVPEKWNQVVGNYLGRNNTWAIFWYAVILENNGLCLAPYNSVVRNCGIDGSGTHKLANNAFMINTDINHRIDEFPEVLKVDEDEYFYMKKQLRKIYRKGRIRERIKKMMPRSLYLFISNQMYIKRVKH